MEHQVDASEVMCLYNPIMQSINAKLDSMLERNQVTGKDAANVYLHALETTLHEVVLLLLGADQRKLILAQTGKENAGTNLVIQQTENAALEGLNIPKEGNKIDQEVLKLAGETSLIPKQSELMDAQIVHLLRENEKLEWEKRLLELQGDNLVIEGVNLGKQTDLLIEQIKALREDVKGKAMDIKVKGTQAELNRAQAMKVAADQASMRGKAYAEILSIMVQSWNTTIAHSIDLPSAFDKNAINSCADSALTSVQNYSGITYFTAP